MYVYNVLGKMTFLNVDTTFYRIYLQRTLKRVQLPNKQQHNIKKNQRPLSGQAALKTTELFSASELFCV